MSSSDRISELLARQYAADHYRLSRWGRVIPYPRDTALLKLLNRIDGERSQSRMEATNSHWLVKHRSEIRNAISSGSIDTIRLYLCRCPSEMVPVCVWLWGKCVDRFRLYGLSRFCHSSSQKVRRHVAKTLRRVEAWALLDEMAAAYPEDARIRWYANAPTTHRSFTKRLKKFAANVDDSHAGEVHTPSQMLYWASENSWERTPPKSLELIRRILRRIQHWVHWGVGQ